MTQFPIIGKREDGVVRREFQIEYPAGFAVPLGAFTGGTASILGNAGQERLVFNVLAPAIRRIQQIVLKLAGEFGQFQRNRFIAFLLRLRQGHARQAKITQGIVDDFALRIIQGGIFRPVGQRLHGME